MADSRKKQLIAVFAESLDGQSGLCYRVMVGNLGKVRRMLLKREFK